VEQRGHQEARIGHRGERPDLPQDESDGGDDLGPDREGVAAAEGAGTHLGGGGLEEG
jgi:hypothetical protein